MTMLIEFYNSLEEKRKGHADQVIIEWKESSSLPRKKKKKIRKYLRLKYFISTVPLFNF